LFAQGFERVGRAQRLAPQFVFAPGLGAQGGGPPARVVQLAQAALDLRGVARQGFARPGGGGHVVALVLASAAFVLYLLEARAQGLQLGVAQGVFAGVDEEAADADHLGAEPVAQRFVGVGQGVEFRVHARERGLALGQQLALGGEAGARALEAGGHLLGLARGAHVLREPRALDLDRGELRAARLELFGEVILEGAALGGEVHAGLLKDGADAAARVLSGALVVFDGGAQRGCPVRQLALARFERGERARRRRPLFEFARLALKGRDAAAQALDFARGLAPLARQMLARRERLLDFAEVRLDAEPFALKPFRIGLRARQILRRAHALGGL
jgi:hypothetical protein